MTILPKPATFEEADVPRPPVSGIDVVTTLAHFAIVTYTVRPEILRPMIPERFGLELIDTDDGPRALLSVVPFEDQDFRFAAVPFFKMHFGQTNYRAYVIDKETGRRAVWFFGTLLDSWTVVVPRNGWRLPWHRGRIRFDVDLGSDGESYARYRMDAAAKWAGATFEASSEPGESSHPGFPTKKPPSSSSRTRWWATTTEATVPSAATVCGTRRSAPCRRAAFTHGSICSNGWGWCRWRSRGVRTVS